MTTTPITADQRAELRRLCDEATPGPWRQRCHSMTPDVLAPSPVGGECLVARTNLQPDDANDQECADSLFIATSRTAIPALLDMLDSVERERDDAMGAVRDLEGIGAIVQRLEAQLAAATAKLATYERVVQAAMGWLATVCTDDCRFVPHSCGCPDDHAEAVLIQAAIDLRDLPAPSKGVP